MIALAVWVVAGLVVYLLARGRLEDAPIEAEAPSPTA